MRALTGLLALCAALVFAATAGASVREIGAPSASPFPAAACPTSCSAIVRVTGYQVQIGKTKNPFVVSQAGRVVAFTIELGSPSTSQLQYFTSHFGGDPEVRLSVLRPRARHQLQLVAQSELFDLMAYLGSTQTFALATSLKVPAGGVIALTTPTWAPAFAVALGPDEAWRSSRPHCGNAVQPAIQQTSGQSRTYNCLYKGARLLYSATFIPDPIPARKKPTASTRRRP